jgi:hypothetical protein
MHQPAECGRALFEPGLHRRDQRSRLDIADVSAVLRRHRLGGGKLVDVENDDWRLNAGASSHLTRRWREADSNRRSLSQKRAVFPVEREVP